MATTKFMKGNEAAAEAAIRCGLDAFFGYPLTPSSEVPEYIAAHFGGIFVQAESELASISKATSTVPSASSGENATSWT